MTQLHRARPDPKNPLMDLTISPLIGYMARLSLTSIASFARQSILRSSFDGFPPLIPILVLVLAFALVILLRDTVISILIGYRPSWTVAVPLFLIIGRFYWLGENLSKPRRARRWHDDNGQLRFQTSQHWTQRQQPDLFDV